MLKRLILTALVFIAGLSLYGATQETGIKLQTVFEKTFPDTIVDVIFDTATVSLSEAKAMGWKTDLFSAEEKGKGKVNIPYPCVLITKEKVSFLDRGGKEKKSIKRLIEGVKWEDKEGVHIGKGLIKVRKSKNGEYLAVVIPKETGYEGNVKGTLVMYRKDGKEMWRLNDVYLSEGYVTPSPSGEYAIALPPGEYPAGAPAFYSRDGMKFLKVREWNNGWNNDYAVEDFDFSGDGRYLVIGVYRFPVRDTGYVMLFDESGNEIWSKSTEEGVSYVRISDSGKYIAVCITSRGEITSDESVMMLSNKGNLLWKKSFSRWDGHALSFDERNSKFYISWFHRENYLKTYGINTGNELWSLKWDSLDNHMRFVEILPSKDLSYIFLIGSRYRKDDGLYIVSLKGKIVRRSFYKDKPFTYGKYRLELDGNFTNLIDIERYRLRILKVRKGG